MATSLDTRFYVSVSANDSEVDDCTPDNGKIVCIYEVGGNGCASHDVKVQITFGTEILFSTHGDAVHKTSICLTGDGSKKLSISLINDSDVAETIGGFYKGTEI